MTTLHETAYPRFKPDPTAKELQDIYTHTEAERLCVANNHERPNMALGGITPMQKLALAA